MRKNPARKMKGGVLGKRRKSGLSRLEVHGKNRY